MLLCLEKTFSICLSWEHLVHSVIPLGWATTVKIGNFSMQVSQRDAIISAILAWKLFILAWNWSTSCLEWYLICCSSNRHPLSWLVSLSSWSSPYSLIIQTTSSFLTGLSLSLWSSPRSLTIQTTFSFLIGLSLSLSDLVLFLMPARQQSACFDGEHPSLFYSITSLLSLEAFLWRDAQSML